MTHATASTVNGNLSGLIAAAARFEGSPTTFLAQMLAIQCEADFEASAWQQVGRWSFDRRQCQRGGVGAHNVGNQRFFAIEA